MGKTTKRVRKFQAAGGVKGRLEKGTIRKGQTSFRKKPRNSTNNDSGGATRKDAAVQAAGTASRDDNSNNNNNNNNNDDDGGDFLGAANVADLDIDSFFVQMTKVMEKQSGRVEIVVGDSHFTENGSEENDNETDDSESDEDDDDNDLEAAKAMVDGEEKEDSDSSSDDSDSLDDEGIEIAEARMKKEMSKMEQDDPDFHSFLQKNEKELLEFGHGDDDDKVEEEKDDNGGGDSKMKEADEAAGDGKGPNQVVLTSELLAKLEKGAFEQHGMKSLKKIVNAYRSACHLADGDGVDQKKTEGSGYIVESSKIFDKLMVLCLNQCHQEFRHHLFGKVEEQRDRVGDDDKKEEDDIVDEAGESMDNSPIDPKMLEKAPRWPEVNPILLSFLRSTLHILAEVKEADLLSFILKALSKYLPLLTPFPRLAESMLKCFVSLWSAPLDTSPDYQVVRLHAFLRIRQLALTQPFPFVEDCLKKTYLAYAKRAKFGNSSAVSTAMPTLTFMGNCLVQLYSLDYHSSYQHAFVYIRQLALHLRAALQKKTEEAFSQVFCWQYMHCLKLWVAVLSHAVVSGEDAALMRSLIYPLTEIILGTCRLAPSPVRHLPLRFHCVRLLQQLAAASESFIPTTLLLLEVLEWKEWTVSPKKTKAGTVRGSMQLIHLLKLPKDDALRIHEQREAGMNDFFLLLEREIELYRYAAAFPEFRVRIVQVLRQFNKKIRSPKWTSFGKACIDTCEKYAQFAVVARAKLAQAPKDVTRLECMLPPDEMNMHRRHEASIQKEAKSMEAARPASETGIPKERPATDDIVADEDKAKTESTKNKRKTKKKTPEDSTTSGMVEPSGDGFMEQEDQVEEGVDWSDED